MSVVVKPLERPAFRRVRVGTIPFIEHSLQAHVVFPHDPSGSLKSHEWLLHNPFQLNRMLPAKYRLLIRVFLEVLTKRVLFVSTSRNTLDRKSTRLNSSH